MKLIFHGGGKTWGYKKPKLSSAPNTRKHSECVHVWLSLVSVALTVTVASHSGWLLLLRAGISAERSHCPHVSPPCLTAFGSPCRLSLDLSTVEKSLTIAAVPISGSGYQLKWKYVLILSRFDCEAFFVSVNEHNYQLSLFS